MSRHISKAQQHCACLATYPKIKSQCACVATYPKHNGIAHVSPHIQSTTASCSTDGKHRRTTSDKYNIGHARYVYICVCVCICVCASQLIFACLFKKKIIMLPIISHASFYLMKDRHITHLATHWYAPLRCVVCAYVCVLCVCIRHCVALCVCVCVCMCVCRKTSESISPLLTCGNCRCQYSHRLVILDLMDTTGASMRSKWFQTRQSSTCLVSSQAFDFFAKQ